MPDTMRMLEAQALAAVLAGILGLLCGWRWRAGQALGVYVGMAAGCWWLGLWPHWPPAEDQGRLLLVLLPAALLVESLAMLPARRHWLLWLSRACLGFTAARIVLHNSIYLTAIDGFENDSWSPLQAMLILAGLGATLMSVWTALLVLTRRPGGRAVPLAVACTCAGAAVAIMYSSSLSGGQMGLPLAAALGGAGLASLLWRSPATVGGILSLGVVGLFALLLGGHFFADLTTPHALVLFFAPLCCWLPELPVVCRLRPLWRGGLRVALTALPVALVVLLARQQFDARGTAVPSGSEAPASHVEPTVDDYLNYSK